MKQLLNLVTVTAYCGLVVDFVLEMQESLRSEVQALEAVVDHHPELVRFKMENEVLKSEICRLRATQTTFDLQDQKKAEDLEQIFLQLQAESKLQEEKC